MARPSTAKPEQIESAITWSRRAYPSAASDLAEISARVSVQYGDDSDLDDILTSPCQVHHGEDPTRWLVFWSRVDLAFCFSLHHGFSVYL